MEQPAAVAAVAQSDDDLARVAVFFGEIEGAAEQVYCERRLLHPRYRFGFTRFIYTEGVEASWH